MDISNINETLLKGIQQAQFEQAQVLSKVLGVKIGDSFLAQVAQLAKASPEERAQLAEQLAKTLSQLNPNSAAPATKALINQLLVQQAMVQSSDLKIVTLNTQGSQQQLQNLLTYTNLPLEQGQPLLLKLDNNQRLVILGILAKEGFNFPQLQTLNQNELMQNLKPLPSQPSSATGNPLPSPNQTLTIAPQTLNALRSSITNLLPRKDLGQDLLSNMQWISQHIQKMPLQERNQWFSSDLQQALKTLANHLRSPQELSHPKLLAGAVHNSGVFFEQKLTGLIPKPTTTAPMKTPSAANPTAPQNLGALINTGNITDPGKMTNLNKIIDTNKMTALGKMVGPDKNPLLNTDKSIPTKNPEQTIKQDLKGALLSVLHQVEEELDPLSALLPGKSSSNPLLPGAQPQLAQVFAQIMGMSSALSSHKELNIKTLRAQLMMLLQQHTLGSLAKIQLQQIHSMNHQIDQTDSPLPNQSWQFEIPMRHGQDIHHLHMQMEYHWVDEENSQGQPGQSKTKQWQVMLGFNMDSIGQFYVQLILVGNNLSANFWAERTTTLEKTRKKLDELQEQLEREGIQVKSMQCLAGLPPKPKMSLGYSLVDIQT